MIDLVIIKSASSLCRATYAYPGDPRYIWDHFDDGDSDGVVWGAKKIDGLWRIALRGSVKLQDWIRDAEALAVRCASLNGVTLHPGFNAGMQHTASEVSDLVGTDPWLACGHSLGAARADNLTAYAIKDGWPPIACIVFGEPKPGFRDFGDFVAEVPRVSFINQGTTGHDCVPDLPVRLILEPYTWPSPLVALDVTPPPFDGVDLFRFHHMQLYDPAVQLLTQSPA